MIFTVHFGRVNSENIICLSYREETNVSVSLVQTSVLIGVYIVLDMGVLSASPFHLKFTFIHHTLMYLVLSLMY